MGNYFSALTNAFKNWKTAVIVTVFTIARIWYGWGWVTAGWHKLAWLSDGKINAAGKIEGLVKNIDTGAKHFDPLSINKIFSWIAQHIFLKMPALTDFLVVVFEIGVGLFIIFGLRIFWAALVATFLNLQFFAAGSFNNFGYVWTNLVIMKWAPYFEAIGISGFLKVRKGKDLV